MFKRPLLPAILLCMACILWLTSCVADAPILLVDADISRTDTPAVPSPRATGTSTPAATPTPTEPAVPTATPTKWPSQRITLDNASSLKEMNSWGRGSVLRTRKLENKPGEYLVLAPSVLYRYGSSDPFLLGSLPEVDDFVLSGDGRWLATSRKNGDVDIWDTGSFSLKQSISHAFPEEIVQGIQNRQILPYYVGGMAFSPDGSQMAIGYVDGKIELWRLGEPAPYATLQHEALGLWKTDITLLFELSFSPDGTVLTAFKLALSLHENNANRLTFWSVPEAKLLSVSDAGQYNKLPQETYLPDGNTMIVFARDGSHLRLQLWDIRAGKRVHDFATILSKIDTVELTPAGDRLTVLGSDMQEQEIRQVWALPGGELVESEEHDPLPGDGELARFQKFLRAQGHYDNTWGSEEEPGQARLVHEGTLPIRVLEEDYLLTLPGGSIEAAGLPAEGTHAYYDPQGNFTAWCEPGKLVIRDQNGATASTDLPFPSNCVGVVVSSKKHYAALWNSQALYIQDLETGKYSKPVFDWRWKREPMLTAVFSEDEQILITSKTALITVWQVDPLQKIADSHNEYYYVGNNLEIALTKDKATAVTLSMSRGSTSDRSSQILVWRVADGFIRHRINPPLIGESQPRFTSFALSPDGSLIASGDDFGGIRLWSVESGEELASYGGPYRPLDLAFTPDGAGLVVLLDGGTVRLLGVP